MPLSKITKFFISLSLLLTFTIGGSVAVNAEEQLIQATKKRKCNDYPYDRPANAEDEEKSSGDCTGTVPTPEPVSILLFTAGLAGVGFAARRRLRRSE